MNYTELKIKDRTLIGAFKTNLSKSIEIYSYGRTICPDRRKTNWGDLIFPVSTGVQSVKFMHLHLHEKNATGIFLRINKDVNAIKITLSQFTDKIITPDWIPEH